MNEQAPQTADYRPRLLDPRDPTDRATSRQLADTPGIQTGDLRAGLPAVLRPLDASRRAPCPPAALTPGIHTVDPRARLHAERDQRTGPPPGLDPGEERWVHYPWRNAPVAALGPDAFVAIRSDRNRNKL